MISSLFHYLLGPVSARLYFRRAEKKYKLGKLDAATNLYRAAIEADKTYIPAYLSVSRLLIESQKNADAVPRMRYLAGLYPSEVAVQSMLGRLLSESRNESEVEDAIACYKVCLEAEPEAVHHLMNVGNLNARLMKVEAAIPVFRKALELQPFDDRIHLALATANLKTGKFILAENYCWNARQLNSSGTQPIKALGDLYIVWGKLKEAKECFEYIKEHTLASGVDIYIARLLYMQGEYSGALSITDKIMASAGKEVASDYEVSLLAAMAHLVMGHFDVGWDLYESRNHMKDNIQAKKSDAFLLWDGQPGVDVLIYAEQGIGDEIMFSSCIQDVINVSKKCYVECNPRLAKLFKHSFPQAIVNAYGIFKAGKARGAVQCFWDKAANLPDVHKVAMGSLPKFFRKTKDQFPNHEGYLLVDDLSKEYWRKLLDSISHKPKIGIAWRGGLPRSGVEYRSLHLANFLPIFRSVDADFISLQYGDADQEINSFNQESACNLLQLTDVTNDFYEVSALMLNLDLIISVQSAVVHLAGALGKPVLALVSASPEWRYMAKGDSMPWYPSATLFRQATLGDWSSVLEDLQIQVTTKFGTH